MNTGQATTKCKAYCKNSEKKYKNFKASLKVQVKKKGSRLTRKLFNV